MNGATGLLYASVYPLLDRLHQDDPIAWQAAFDDIQTMERAALGAMRGDENGD